MSTTISTTIIDTFNKILLSIALFALFIVGSYGQVASIVASGLINVLPAGARDAQGKLIQAGLSAVVFTGDRVVYL